MALKIPRAVKIIPWLIRPLVPFPLNKLIPRPYIEPRIIEFQKKYADYDEDVPFFLATRRARFIDKCETIVIWVLSIATAVNVYRYATKQELYFQFKKKE